MLTVQMSTIYKQILKMTNVITTFSGYDSQCLALRKAGIDFNLVAWAEFDKLLATDENGKRLLSNSALYKLAGNSIVENCLTEIYKKIWSQEDVPHYQKGQQLTLPFL